MISRVGVAMALVVLVPGLAGCNGQDDPQGKAPAASPASASPTATPLPEIVIDRAMFSPTTKSVSARLTCSGQGAWSRIGDRGIEPPADPQSVDELVAYWASQQSNRANADWDDAAPPRPTYFYPRDPARSYRAVVDFVRADGRVVLSLELDRWENSDDAWHAGHVSACGQRAPATSAAAPSPTVQIDVSLFQPRVQRRALDLDCSGTRMAGGVYDHKLDRRLQPPLSTDAETDGLAGVAREWGRNQSSSNNSAWDDRDPPAPIIYFPRAPQDSQRAVVQFVTKSGTRVALFVAERHVADGLWHVSSDRWCAY